MGPLNVAMQLQCISFALTDGESKEDEDGDGNGKLVFAFSPSITRAASSYAFAAFFAASAVSNVPSQILVFLQRIKKTKNKINQHIQNKKSLWSEWVGLS